MKIHSVKKHKNLKKNIKIQKPKKMYKIKKSKKKYKIKNPKKTIKTKTKKNADPCTMGTVAVGQRAGVT